MLIATYTENSTSDPMAKSETSEGSLKCLSEGRRLKMSCRAEISQAAEEDSSEKSPLQTTSRASQICNFKVLKASTKEGSMQTKQSIGASSVFSPSPALLFLLSCLSL